MPNCAHVTRSDVAAVLAALTAVNASARSEEPMVFGRGRSSGRDLRDIYEKSPEESELISVLDELGDDALRELVAIYYFGRDGDWEVGVDAAKSMKRSELVHFLPGRNRKAVEFINAVLPKLKFK